MRTSVASRKMATAMPKPVTRSTRRSPRTNAAKMQIMMAAAEVMTRPVAASGQVRLNCEPASLPATVITTSTTTQPATTSHR
jgi:hypothetical protein